MISEQYRKLAEKWGQFFSIDPDLIEAIIMKESSGNKEAVKIELGFYDRYVKQFTFSDTEEYCRSFSWGLMQIMGQTARELGFNGKYFTELTSDPDKAIEFGCRYLRRQLSRYPSSLTDAISAYNAGSVARAHSGGYKNQDYVNKVLSFLKQIQSERI